MAIQNNPLALHRCEENFFACFFLLYIYIYISVCYYIIIKRKRKERLEKVLIDSDDCGLECRCKLDLNDPCKSEHEGYLQAAPGRKKRESEMVKLIGEKTLEE